MFQVAKHALDKTQTITIVQFCVNIIHFQADCKEYLKHLSEAIYPWTNHHNYVLFRGNRECFLLKVRHVYITTNVLTKDTDSSYLLSASQHVGAEEAKINRSASSATHD